MADSTFERVRIDPHGRVSGLILADGTDVAAAPGEAAQLAQQVRSGDPIALERGPGNSFVVLDGRTGGRFALGSMDSVGRGGGPPSSAVPYQLVDNARDLPWMTTQGRVTRVLHTPNGDTSGLLLDNGMQVRIVPGVEGVVAAMRLGDIVTVGGRGTATPAGSALWAIRIAQPSGLVLLDMTRGRHGLPELGLGR
jgi:hypothetical protein